MNNSGKPGGKFKASNPKGVELNISQVPTHLAGPDESPEGIRFRKDNGNPMNRWPAISFLSLK